MRGNGMTDCIETNKRYGVTGKDLATLDLYVDEAYRSARISDITLIRDILKKIIDKAWEVF